MTTTTAKTTKKPRFELEHQDTSVVGELSHTGWKIYTSSPRKVCQILHDTAKDGGRPWTVREWNASKGRYVDLDHINLDVLKLEAYEID